MYYNVKCAVNGIINRERGRPGVQGTGRDSVLNRVVKDSSRRRGRAQGRQVRSGPRERGERESKCKGPHWD